jgi:hypothetical protein
VILKLLVSAIFTGATVQKFTGKVAPDLGSLGLLATVHVCNGHR